MVFDFVYQNWEAISKFQRWNQYSIQSFEHQILFHHEPIISIAKLKLVSKIENDLFFVKLLDFFIASLYKIKTFFNTFLNLDFVQLFKIIDFNLFIL